MLRTDAMTSPRTLTHTAAAAAAAAVAANLMAAWFVLQERAVYFWDFRSYWVKYQAATELLQSDLRAAAGNLLASLRLEDYNNLAAFGLAPFGLLFGTGRLAFILAIVNVYLIPALLLSFVVFAAALARAGLEVSPGKIWFYWAAMLLFAPLWNPILYGYIDIGGWILMAAAALVYFGDGGQKAWWRPIAAGVLLALLVLFRRWYAYWAIGFFAAVLVDLLAQAARTRRVLALRSAATSGTTAAVTLGAVAWPLALRMARTDYVDLYSYARGDAHFLGLLAASVDRIGWGNTALFCAASAFLLARRETRRIALFVLVQLAVATVFFLRVQAFDAHHVYLAVPGMLLVIFLFLWMTLSKMGKTARAALACGFLAVSACGMAAVFVPEAAALGTTLGPLAPHARHYPRVRTDLAELERLLDVLDRLRGPGDTAYVLASSETLNSDILAFLRMSRCLGDRPESYIAATHAVDKRDGSPTPLLEARWVVVGDPVQYIARPCDQRVVGVPARRILDQEGFGRAYRRIPGEFRLDGGVRAYIYERTSPVPDADVAALERSLTEPCGS